MLVWFKEKWKIIVSAAVVLMGILLTLFRINSNSQSQKNILARANESHKKELEVIKKSEEELRASFEKLKKEEVKEVIIIEKEEVEKLDKLQKEKKDFVDGQKSSKELAENLANAIGADFVDSSDD